MPRRRSENSDVDAYQTVFAEVRGAVAAPTAGLHFTPELLEKIRQKGVHIVNITLHVGYGTFRPVEVENLADHPMHTETCEITKDVAEVIAKAKKEGRRIIACGTTTVRTLESAAQADVDLGNVKAGKRETNIFIYPPFEFKIVDALITNFHLPSSTLIMLVAAFAGKERVLAAYEEAKAHAYRFYSYGDVMLIV